MEDDYTWTIDDQLLAEINRTLQTLASDAGELKVVTHTAEHVIMGWHILATLLLFVGNGILLYVSGRFVSQKIIPHFYITNIAVANICYALAMPFSMVEHLVDWNLVSCKLYQAVVQIHFTPQQLFMLLLAADRFLLICHPQLSREWRSLKNAHISAGVVWGIVFLESILRMIFAHLKQVHGGYVVCDGEIPHHMFYTVYVGCIYLMTILLVGLTLYRTYSYQTQPQLPLINEGKAEDPQLTKFLLIFLAVYLLLPLPYDLTELAPHNFILTDAGLWLTIVLYALAQTETILEPILCILLSPAHKQGFLRTIRFDRPKPVLAKQIAYERHANPGEREDDGEMSGNV